MFSWRRPGSGQDLALRIDQPEQIALPAVVDAEYALTWLGVRRRKRQMYPSAIFQNALIKRNVGGAGLAMGTDGMSHRQGWAEFGAGEVCRQPLAMLGTEGATDSGVQRW